MTDMWVTQWGFFAVAHTSGNVGWVFSSGRQGAELIEGVWCNLTPHILSACRGSLYSPLALSRCTWGLAPLWSVFMCNYFALWGAREEGFCHISMLRGCRAVGQTLVGPTAGRPPAILWGKNECFLLGSEETWVSPFCVRDVIRR